MSWLAQIRSEFGALRGRAGRDLQLRLDTARLYILTHTGFAKSLPPNVESVELDSLPAFEKQHAYVSGYAASAAIDLIVRAGEGAKPNPARQTHETQYRATPAHGGRMGDATASAFSAMQVPSGRRIRTRERPQFSLGVRQSSITGAGLGVYVDGEAEPGTVLTLYPGLTYKPSEVMHMPDYPNVSLNNEYLMWRYDGVIVDGSSDSLTSVMDFNRPDAPSAEELTTFAVGQIVNHPPKGGSPNALQYAVTLDARVLAPRLRCFLPNLPFHVAQERRVQSAVEGVDSVEFRHGDADVATETVSDTWKDVERKLVARTRRDGLISRSLSALEDMVIRQRVAGTASGAYEGRVPRHAAFESLVIIATQHIKDEEVFINYRFNPASPDLPDWYEDCNPAESSRRWRQEGFWGSS